MNKDFLTVEQLSRPQIYEVFEYAEQLRGQWEESGLPLDILRGHTLALIFEKPSTRTRISFEVAARQLGASSLFLSPQDIHLGSSESLEDTARTLSRYVNGVVLRTFAHETVVRFAASSSVPVVNGLTDLLHPCQAMADYYTLWRRGKLAENTRIVYIGDGNNVCHSLMLAAARLGSQLTVCTPEDYQPAGRIWTKVAKAAGSIVHTSDPRQAARGANVLYTDVWASMGQEHEKQERNAIFASYQVNEEILSVADKGAVVMHCLPAHRGEEITDAVIDGPQSIVWDQAENRLHIQKALLAMLLAPKSEKESRRQ